MATALRRGLPPAATVLGVAAALRLLYEPWFLNYDARYALLWARDFWQGFTPEYKADFAPTPHPLQMAFSSLALPFGEAADDLLTIAALLCFGAVVYLIYRLGSVCFHPAVGVVAALVVATRPVMHRDAILAYQDVPFAALVVAAVILEARQPRRGPPVLALLALAGLLRPEAWLLAGLYFLYLWPSLDMAGRARAVGLAAVAPLIWAGSDWAVTGDPLHSLHGTADLAEAVDRRRSVDQVPYWTAQYLGSALREPVVAGVPVGLAFAWLYRRNRRAVLPVAVAAAMLLVFAVGPIFGLPLIARYVRTPAGLLAIFYGVAVFGWLLLDPGRTRQVWKGIGAVTALLSVVWIPWHVDMLRNLDRRIARDGGLYSTLRDVGEAPEVRAAFAACGPLTTADHRPIPYIRWWLDGKPGSVGTVAGGASPLSKLVLTPRSTPATRARFREDFPKFRPPAGYRLLYRNSTWQVHVAPGCEHA
jgi:hypothetical protein